MIGFAACVADSEKLARCAAPGLRRAMEPDSAFAELTAAGGSIHEAYDEALEHFSAVEDLEALVLLHEDLELLDTDFCQRVRSVLADPAVAVAGPIGARGVRSLAWWEGRIAGVASEPRGVIDGPLSRSGVTEVEALDGMLLVLSPWAVRHLRFSGMATAGGFHGYDVELCFAARDAGRSVVTFPTAIFHHTKGGLGDEAAWAQADAAFRERWIGSAAPLARG